MRILFCLLLAGTVSFARMLEPVISPRATGMAGAIVASPIDPTSVLHNPAALSALQQMGSDMSFGTRVGGTDRWLWAYANPMSDEGSRFGFGAYADGQTQPADTKFLVPFVSASWQPMGRLSLGAVAHFIREVARKNQDDSKWSNSIDIGLLTPGERVNFGVNVRNAFGGTSVVTKTLQGGAAVCSDNKKLNIAYQWDGDLLNGVKYRYTASRLGTEYVLGKVGIARAGYVWSDVHRVTFGTAFGMMDGGSLIQLGCSLPTKGKAPTEWSVGLSYRI